MTVRIYIFSVFIDQLCSWKQSFKTHYKELQTNNIQIRIFL